MKHHLTVSEEYQGLRLDVFLTNSLPDIPSRMFVKKIIEAGQVSVNGKTPKPNYKVVLADQIEVDVDPALLVERELEPQKIDLDIFYEDDDLLVINKPIGLTVHPASGHYADTLVNGLIYHFDELSDRNGPARPGIVHRLDKDTSGLILVAKTNVAHARLGRQFEKHTVIKKYVARVQGHVQFDQGKIDVAIDRHDKYHDQRQVAQTEGEGKHAMTLYQVLKRFKKSTLIALYPQTGRTHQLRVHMKHLGHPILGDDKYGRKESFSRLALHAQGIGFIHPITKHYVEFSCTLPPEFLVEDS